MQLLRHLGPQILDPAKHFDGIIFQPIDDYFDLQISYVESPSHTDIPSNAEC